VVILKAHERGDLLLRPHLHPHDVLYLRDVPILRGHDYGYDLLLLLLLLLPFRHDVYHQLGTFL
jgi:hypothetical protein